MADLPCTCNPPQRQCPALREMMQKADTAEGTARFDLWAEVYDHIGYPRAAHLSRQRAEALRRQMKMEV